MLLFNLTPQNSKSRSHKTFFYSAVLTHKEKFMYSHKLACSCTSQPTGSEESLTTTPTRGGIDPHPYLHPHIPLCILLLLAVYVISSEHFRTHSLAKYVHKNFWNPTLCGLLLQPPSWKQCWWPQVLTPNFQKTLTEIKPWAGLV